MDSLTGAIVAAAVAWASILLAAVLPIPAYAFTRLRWVGGVAIGLVALALVGLPVPGYLTPVVLVGGAIAAFAWPHQDAKASLPRETAQRQP